MVRTVKDMREKLHAGAMKQRVWSTLRRKAVFGMSEASVRKQLQTVTFCGKKVAVHKKIVASLAAVEHDIRAHEKAHKEEAWVPDRIDCFSWRPIRGGTSLSRHAHAVALDINPRTNAYHTSYTGSASQTTDIPIRVFQAFKDHGWTLGVEWNKPLDSMHVQYC